MDIAAADEEEPDEDQRPCAATDARRAGEPHFEPPPLGQGKPESLSRKLVAEVAGVAEVASGHGYLRVSRK